MSLALFLFFRESAIDVGLELLAVLLRGSEIDLTDRLRAHDTLLLDAVDELIPYPHFGADIAVQASGTERLLFFRHESSECSPYILSFPEACSLVIVIISSSSLTK